MTGNSSPYTLEGRMTEVRDRLRRTRSGWLRARMGAGLLWVWSAAAAGLLLVTLAAIVWNLPSLGLSGFMWALLVGAVVSSTLVVGRALRAWPSALELALEAGQQDPRVRSRLVGGLELWARRGSGREGYSRALIDAVAEDTWRLAADVDFGQVIPSRSLARSSRVFAVCIAAWIALTLAATDGVVSSLRQFPVVLTGEAVPTLHVEPGDCEIPPGESLAIRARVGAPGVREATILYDRDGQGWRSVSMETDAVEAGLQWSAFHLVFSRIERPFRYAVASGKARSDTFRVGIRARPKVVRLQVDYDYPGYTGLPHRKGAEGDGKITALKGTMATLRLHANRPLESVYFVVDDSDTVRGRIEEDPKQASGRIRVMKDGQYRICVVDEEGFAAERPEAYPVVCLEDEVPMVDLDSPATEAVLPPDMMVALRGAAHDDYGFSRVLLRFFLPGDEVEESLEISGPVRVKEYGIDYSWRVADLGLLPGEVLTYYIEVWDNDAVSGPKRAATDLHSLRFPSVAEIFAQADRMEEEDLEELKDVYEDERLLRDRLEEISRDIQREEKLSWEEQKEIEQAAKKQQDINARLEEVAHGIQEATETLGGNELLSMEILEKMAELQRLVEEVATPEMREAMRKLQEAIDQLDREEIEKALENFEMSQEEFLERLKRSIELMERLRIERKMEELAQVAEELAERQGELARDTETAPADSLENLAPREDQIAKEAEGLEREISRVAEMARELEPEASTALSEIAQAMQEDEVIARLQDIRNALSQGNMSEAQSKAERGARDLDELAEQLRMAQNQLSMEKRRKLAEAIENLTHDLVWFSFQEEDLASEIQTLRRKDLEARRDVADRQLGLRTCATRTLGQLRQLSRQTFLVSPGASRSLAEALDHMQEAARILEGGNVTPADKEGLQAMALINRAVLALMESRQCMSSCSSPMGLNEMLQKLESMSCQQAGINQGTQQLMQQVGRQGQSMQLRAQAARLAAEQAAVRKSAEALAGEMGNQPQILGRMEGLISEMENVIRDLESLGLGQETVDRQKRILSRLLDAQKSVRRRDYTRVRLSRVGADGQAVSPEDLSPDTRWVPSEIREDLLRAAGESYPLRYESLIRSYFRSLAKEESSSRSEP
ncbi:MAG: hypothetical protein KAW17_06380 [Candidatus Eisenbacteria sp.]|nr:hypothetical protein [Candidatus Eisenbacteria bacterium]